MIDISPQIREKGLSQSAARLMARVVIMRRTPAICFLFRHRWQAQLLLISFAACLNVSGRQAENAPNTVELRTISAVRNLSVEQTRQNIPVHLKGVVTFYDDRLYSHFVQDESAGIYIQFPTNVAPPALRSGQIIELTGACSPGEYAPVVVADAIKVIGTAPLPQPKAVTYEDLASGVEDSQYVEITGVVRSARYLAESQYHLLDIATGGGRLVVYAPELPVKKDEDLADSGVRIRGVCSTKFNHKRQLFAIRLMVPRPQDLEIILPPPQNPFSIPARPVGSLLQFAPQESYGHRVKVEGTVIYHIPGEQMFLQDREQGVEVQSGQTNLLQVGDRVEVLGFVGEGAYTPMLQDATYRKVFSGAPPSPSILSVDEVLRGNHDCRLIQVTGRLLDRTQHGSERSLILQSGNVIFPAYLKQTTEPAAFAALENGSSLKVIGVCQIDPGEWAAGEAWRAKGFKILMRSPEDAVLIQAPPWWTVSRMLWMAAALAFAMMAAFAWVAVLRRQVAERTLQLETQIRERQRAERRREIEQERARVAHDLHDDLGAGLTEVNMLTSLVKSSTTSAEEKSRYLDELNETARKMVTSLDEIVWAINPRNDTIASLASYFGSYAQRLLDLAGIACGLDIAEDLPDHSLDPKFRQELFLAFKEALTNVVRHSKATQVWLRISVHGRSLAVELADNGAGFNSAAPATAGDGLSNMEERMKSLGGNCRVLSDSKGTIVRLSAPLPERL